MAEYIAKLKTWLLTLPEFCGKDAPPIEAITRSIRVAPVSHELSQEPRKAPRQSRTGRPNYRQKVVVHTSKTTYGKSKNKAKSPLQRSATPAPRRSPSPSQKKRGSSHLG